MIGLTSENFDNKSQKPVRFFSFSSEIGKEIKK